MQMGILQISRKEMPTVEQNVIAHANVYNPRPYRPRMSIEGKDRLNPIMSIAIVKSSGFQCVTPSAVAGLPQSLAPIREQRRWLLRIFCWHTCDRHIVVQSRIRRGLQRAD